MCMEIYIFLFHVSYKLLPFSQNSHSTFSLSLRRWRSSTNCTFLCRLRSIATHRDHFVRRLSVRLSVRLSHFSVTLSKAMFAGDTCILGTLPLFFKDTTTYPQTPRRPHPPVEAPPDVDESEYNGQIFRSSRKIHVDKTWGSRAAIKE